MEALLFKAERELDRAFSAVARLNAALPEARLEARLAAVMAQPALSSTTAAQSAIIDARSHLLSTHDRLALVRRQMNLPEEAFGGGDLKPIPA